MNKEPQREEGSKIICAYFFCNTTVRYANFFRSIYFAQYCLLLLGISSCNHIQPSVKHDAEIDICYDLDSLLSTPQVFKLQEADVTNIDIVKGFHSITLGLTINKICISNNVDRYWWVKDTLSAHVIKLHQCSSCREVELTFINDTLYRLFYTFSGLNVSDSVPISNRELLERQFGNPNQKSFHIISDKPYYDVGRDIHLPSEEELTAIEERRRKNRADTINEPEIIRSVGKITRWEAEWMTTQTILNYKSEICGGNQYKENGETTPFARYENQITWEMTGVEKRLATLFTQDSVIAAHKKTEEAKAKIDEALSKH